MSSGNTIDREALTANLRPLDLDAPFHADPDEKRYFQTYGIDFENEIDGLEHYFGAIPCQLANDDYQIACHYYSKSGATRTCYVMHGYLDHTGLFGQLINYLLHRGCNVVAFDLPGHGLSSGERASIESFGDYVLVLRSVLEFFYQQVPTPWFVVAQSTGAAIVMDYLISQQYDETTGPFDKVVLLAPLVRAKHAPLMRPLRRILGLFTTRVPRKFSKNSHDEAFLQRVRDDELASHYMPLRWIRAMLRWERRFDKLSWVEQEVLVVQGEGDQTVAWRHNLDVIRRKFPNAKIYRIQQAGHHLVGESERYFERVTQAMDIYFERRRTPRD